MNTRAWLSLCAGFGLGVGTAGADVWYVATNGSDGAAGKAWETAYATIGYALTQAAAAGYDHEVWVSNGTYTLGAQLYLTKNVRLWGAYGAGQTILDGGKATRCVFITNGILDGFTVTNGLATVALTLGYGGGIYAVTGQVLNCVVTGNRSERGGGGIYGGGNNGASGGLGIISNCVIAGNVATNTGTSGYGGGGVQIYGSGWKVLDCPSINDNKVYYHGGGLKVSGASLVSHCVVSNNAVPAAGGGGPMGGGVYLESSAFVTYCTISSNLGGTNGSGGGVYALNGAVVSNCVLTANWALNGGGVAGNNASVLNCATISGNSALGSTTARGGGIYAIGGSLVSNCAIRANSAASGGGFGCSRSTFTLTHCVVSDNSAEGNPGGVVSHQSESTVRNCLITRNISVSVPAGILMSGDLAAAPVYPKGCRVENCTIVSNRASNASATSGLYAQKTNTVVNTIIVSNYYRDVEQVSAHPWTTFTNCCVTNAATLTGSGNIPDDPKFAAPEANDWHLTAGSPCVNAGTNDAWVEGAQDLDGRARADRFSRQVDMGAFEYLPAGALIQLR